MPARVVRVKTTPGGGQLVAVEFEQPRRSVPAVGKFNRRAAERRPLSLPLSLWPAGAPWPEYAMTLDLSDGGVLIRTPTVYSVGDRVRVALTYGSWTRRGELEAEVVRVEPVPDSVEQRVALAFLHP
jgi:Tfp pilus assembly protein PilZ